METRRVGSLDDAMASHEAAGWRLAVIFPADDPTHVILERGDEQLRLIRDDQPASADRLDPTLARAVLPAISAPVISRRADAPGFGDGRAGLGYRDLVPGRLGGALIASHIAVPQPGPVNDYVHFHHVDFQLIFCRRGWVEVVYEDQGEPFVMRSGDAVLQPPGIRHRVLAAGEDMEVVELVSPALHPTHRDHELALPTSVVAPDRDFGGQRFTRHVTTEVDDTEHWLPGYRSRDLGLFDPSGGAVAAWVLTDSASLLSVDDIVLPQAWTFFFVLEGTVVIEIDDDTVTLGIDDSVVVPQGARVSARGGMMLCVVPGVVPEELHSTAP